MIIFISRDACPYCLRLRESVLEPMLATGQFDHRAILLEINLDRTEPFLGFDGKLLNGKAFGGLYDTRITPTLLFLDHNGEEVSKRRVGISNLEYYRHYLNKSIDEASALSRLQ